jgi:hypothetical protein
VTLPDPNPKALFLFISLLPFTFLRDYRRVGRHPRVVRTSDEELTAVGAGSEVAASFMGRVTDKALAQDTAVAGLEEPRPTAQLVKIFGVFPSWRSNQIPATSRWQATPMARRSISDCVVRGGCGCGCGLDFRTVMETPSTRTDATVFSHFVIRQWVTDGDSAHRTAPNRIVREFGWSRHQRVV